MIGWAVGTEARGPSYWPPIVAERKAQLGALRRFSPPPALGVPPERITEPLTVMLWGITTETVQEWLGASEAAEGAQLQGVAASPGKAVGRARVVLEPEDLHLIEDGDILVCRVTAPSWAPVFSRLGAAVSDVGGIMAHTAIVSREYGLPAVVGTGYATQQIKDGQRIEVDGNTGVVRILDEEVPA
jgi:pyruvate,water dikinase